MNSSNVIHTSNSDVTQAVRATLTPATEGYVALGYAGTDNIIWSNPRACVLIIAAAAMTSPAMLMAACGPDWSIRAYPKIDKKTGARSLMTIDLAAAIISDCEKAGVYNPKLIRGAGVWSSGDGLVINGESVWATNAALVARSGHEGYIYPKVRSIGITADGAIATAEDIAEINDLLAGYIWRHESEFILVSGWITVSILSGALARRPHLLVTGKRGKGKSILMDTIGQLMGENFGFHADAKTTPAGIRQTLNGGAGPILLDEAEGSTGANMDKLMEMSRSAYGDKSRGVVQGTSAGDPRNFGLRACFMLACISPPKMATADKTRYGVVEVRGVTTEAALNPCRLILDHEHAASLGNRVKQLVVSRFNLYNTSLAVIRGAIIASGAEPRQAETVGGLVAGWWILNNATAMTEADAVLILPMLDAKAYAEAYTASDEEDCLDAILSSLVRDRQDSLTIAEAIAHINAKDEGKRWSDVLARVGIKVSESHIQVVSADEHAGLKSLLEGTKFAPGNVSRYLGRIAGAKSKVVWMAEMSRRVIDVPLPNRQGDIVDIFDGKVRLAG
jgi:hypothetical protein